MIAGKTELLATAWDWLRPWKWLHRARWHGLLVFNYHRIGDPADSPWDRALWSTSAEAFAEQVEYLNSHFDLLRPDDLEQHFQDPRQRAVMLTFDDGYRDNYDLAFPILHKLQVPATFFLTTGFLDEGSVPWWDEIAWMIHASKRTTLDPGPWTLESLPLADRSESAIQRLVAVYKKLSRDDWHLFLNWLGEASGSGRCPPERGRDLWMTWDIVREMHRGGMAFGGHTVTHPVLSACSRQQQAWEILNSKRRIEQELNQSISAFSYPVGQQHCFDDLTQSLVAEAGYRWAFSFMGCYAQSGNLDPLALPRVAVHPRINASVFRGMATLPGLFIRTS